MLLLVLLLACSVLWSRVAAVGRLLLLLLLGRGCSCLGGRRQGKWTEGQGGWHVETRQPGGAAVVAGNVLLLLLLLLLCGSGKRLCGG